MSILLLLAGQLIAQNIDTSALRQQLVNIRERDQKTRKQIDSASYMHSIDSSNVIAIEAIIKQFGWPGKSFVGDEGNSTVWLVIQHAELDIQEKYLPLMEASVLAGESSITELGYLKDRILMRQGKPQIYGTQIVDDPQTGGWKFWPIENEPEVNIRRKEAGMIPIEEYATYFGITYTFNNK